MTTGARRTSSHEQELDWTFCDTDSIAIAIAIAIANTHKLSHDEYKAKVLLVRDWFKTLNPYGKDHSILQLEDVNFPLGKAGDLEALDPQRCLAVSAKRYVLFNRDSALLVIRKTSGQGLGRHLLAPYHEPPLDRLARIERIGVPLWQEDLWKEVIRAADTEPPDQTRFMNIARLRRFRRQPICGYDTGASRLVQGLQ